MEPDISSKAEGEYWEALCQLAQTLKMHRETQTIGVRDAAGTLRNEFLNIGRQNIPELVSLVEQKRKAMGNIPPGRCVRVLERVIRRQFRRPGMRLLNPREQ